MMVSINVKESFQDINKINQVLVLKTNPIVKRGQVLYIGEDFSVKKKIVKTQSHWSGKKTIYLQNVQVNKPVTVNIQKTSQNIVIQDSKKKKFNKEISR